MVIQYEVLTTAHLAQLDDFCEKVNHTVRMHSWLLKGLDSRSPNVRIAAEFHDDQITGIIATCTLGYWLGAQELLPVWLGIRLDRVRQGTVPRFAEFMHNTSSLISDYYEARGYFQHYIVRKLSSPRLTVDQIEKVTRAAWAQGPYIPIVEHIVRTEDDFNSLPTVFKTMMGRFRPSVILNMNMPNNKRKERGKVVRTVIQHLTEIKEEHNVP